VLTAGSSNTLQNTIHKLDCSIASFSTFKRERVNRIFFSFQMSPSATNCLRAAG
jgi:hypothetical protein